EDGIENLFDADSADDLADCCQSFIQIHRKKLRRECFVERFARSIACLESAAQAVAMTHVNSERVFRFQILFADAGENFVFKQVHALAGYARDPKCGQIFPLAVLGKIALIKNENLVSIRAAGVEVRWPRRVPVDNVQTQISLLERTLR